MQPDPIIDVPRPPRRKHSLLRDLLEVAIIAGVLYLAIWSALQTVRVEGESMVGTLQNNDLLLASKISYYFGDPQRGDIVILIPPSDPTKDFIKRVIGLPGDEIEIDGSKDPTQILIKPGGKGPWEVLQEPYLPQKWTTNNYCCQPNGEAVQTHSATPVTIPSGDYFVMGDNRNFSSDSRSFGFVARNKILAKAFIRILPFGHFTLGAGPTLIPAATSVLATPLLPALAVAVPASLATGRRRRRRRRRSANTSG